MREPRPQPTPDPTPGRRHDSGTGVALARLLERHLPFLRRLAAHKLGARLRRKDDPDDIVQSTVRKVLQHGPRFQIDSDAQFRALLAQIVRRVIQHRGRWYRQKRRTMHRETTQAGQSSILSGRAASQSSPDQRAASEEEVARLRLALEHLKPNDRDIIVRRTFDEQSFPDIGRDLGISAQAAAKRYQRALPRLASQLTALHGPG
ncbi:MAG: sigma-70 family RNA polymerase sigma factor [Planctomycetota bacterium]